MNDDISTNPLQQSQYTTTSQQAPELPSYESAWGGYVKSLSVLFFVLAIVVVCMLLLKRGTSLTDICTNLFAKGKEGKQKKHLPLTVAQRYTIDQRKSLLVVHFLNKTLLLGVTDAGIHVLEESLQKGSSTHEENVASFHAHLEGLGKPPTDTTRT